MVHGLLIKTRTRRGWIKSVSNCTKWCLTVVLWYCNFPWISKPKLKYRDNTNSSGPVKLKLIWNTTYFLFFSFVCSSVCLLIFVSWFFSWPWPRPISSCYSSRPRLSSWLRPCSIQPASRTAPLGPASRPPQPHPLPSCPCHSPSRSPL